MPAVSIKNVESGLIVFELNDRIYTLKQESSAIRIPFALYEMGRDLDIHNIDSWLFINSRGQCSYATFTQLAAAFVAGRNDAYQLDDMVACGKLVFEYIRNKLFVDGLAGKYAESFDIECMPVSVIGTKLKEAISKPEERSYNRAVRFRNVCERNGWDALAAGWSRLLSFIEPTEIKKKQFPIIDEQLKTSVERLVREHFTRQHVS
jgi:hypothetical protein